MSSASLRWCFVIGLLFCLLLTSGCTTPKGASPLMNTTLAASAAGSAITCAEGQTVCGGICRNTAADSGNCGMCGKACSGGENCYAGVCTISHVYVPTSLVTTLSPGSGISCAEGQTVCSGICRSTAADSSNCGTCGKVCGSGQYCSAGSCVGASAPAAVTITVPVTTAVTKTSAVVTTTGALVLVTGLAPVAVTTTASSGTCSEGKTSCSGTCADLKTDKNNCGTCGTTCPAGTHCYPSAATMIGMCYCDGDTVECSGSCVDPKTDHDNCGSCGKTCGPMSFCSFGRCCDPGEMNCGGYCIWVKTDKNNCGTCGNVCKSTELCSSGKCCDMDETNCGGTCVLLQYDKNNCGTCGHVCPAGSICDNRICTFPAMTTVAVAPHIPF